MDAQASAGRQLNVTAMRTELKAEHRRSRSPTRAPSRSTTSRWAVRFVAWLELAARAKAGGIQWRDAPV